MKIMKTIKKIMKIILIKIIMKIQIQIKRKIVIKTCLLKHISIYRIFPFFN